jgi:hypothetical protein
MGMFDVGFPIHGEDNDVRRTYRERGGYRDRGDYKYGDDREHFDGHKWTRGHDHDDD